MRDVVYLNGSLMPPSQARVSVFDHGFLYGYGLFETMRAYNGRIFLLERHLNRLLEAASVLGLAGLNAAELDKACMDTLAANGLKSARLRLTVSRGEAGSLTGTCHKPTILVTASSYSPPPPEKYDRGFRAGLASFRRCSQSPIVRFKSTSYLVSVMARMEAEAAGLDESLFLNEQGHITEGSTSNIFLVTSPCRLVTPPIESGLLAGITRQVVLELAGSLGLNTIEAEVRLKDLEQASEAFLTSSLIEIMPLVGVRDNTGKVITIGSGKPGPVTRRLMAAYREMVKRETSQ